MRPHLEKCVPKEQLLIAVNGLRPNTRCCEPRICKINRHRTGMRDGYPMRRKLAPSERDGGAEALPFIAPAVDGSPDYAASRRCRLATPNPTTARPSRPSAVGAGTAACRTRSGSSPFVAPCRASAANRMPSTPASIGKPSNVFASSHPLGLRCDAEQATSNSPESNRSAGSTRPPPD